MPQNSNALKPQLAPPVMPNPPSAKSPRLSYLIWILSLLICTLAMGVAFRYIDVPVAYRVYGLLGGTASLATGFASAVLLGIEATIAPVDFDDALDVSLDRWTR